MSFIEGVGDEVTFFVVIIVAVILAAIVTLRNHTPGPQVHLVRARIFGVSRVRLTERASNASRSLESITRRLSNNNNNNSQITTEQQTDNLVTESTSNNSSVENHHSAHANDTIPEQTLIESNPEPASTQASSPDALSGDTDGSNEETIIVDEATVEDGSESSNHEAKEHDQNEAVGNNETAPGEIRVRLKYLDDTERIVATTPSTSIGDFKKKHFQEEIRSSKIVRMIYAGKLLQNTFTIENCRIVDNSVVHVQVLAAPVQQNTPAARQEEFDVGRFLWPIVTVILGLCWMTYFKFPEFYNSLSLGMLFVFSGCFCYFLSRSND